ncbi:MAG TPA: hypothetical protein PLZ51_04960 [Aggregatilineales bacterium]|nr:hypothetical protein [Aggregatilineales bacterium]
MNRLIIMITWLIVMLMLGFMPESIMADEESLPADILVYVSQTESVYTLWLYNTETHEKINLVTHTNWITFLLNPSGMIAYSLQSVEPRDTYLVDVNNLNTPHINITSEFFPHASPIAWSPDGRYLALHTALDGVYSLHVWDGAIFIDVNSQISPETRILSPKWSPDGRYLLFESDNGVSHFLYVWDSETFTTILLYEVPSIPQEDIRNMPRGYTFGGIPSPYYLRWSRDGQYLAIALYKAEITDLIFVWNGEELINITPNNLPLLRVPDYYYTQWSFDGRLAFQLNWYEHKVDHADEIYIWDGNETHNLTQNSQAYYSLGEWNTDNQLIYSMKNELASSSYIFVWDGIFFTAMPKLGHLYSAPRWNSENHLVFSAIDGQIYGWDGQEATNLSQNEPLMNYSPSWSLDGRWATQTYSTPQIIYVRDRDNHTLFEMEGGQDIRWSNSGYLTFCKWVERGWGLFLWDGEQTIEITQGREIQGKWQGGGESMIVCSSG